MYKLLASTTSLIVYFQEKQHKKIEVRKNYNLYIIIILVFNFVILENINFIKNYSGKHLHRWIRFCNKL